MELLNGMEGSARKMNQRSWQGGYVCEGCPTHGHLVFLPKVGYGLGLEEIMDFQDD